ncbi:MULTISPECIES: AAA family ATPase [unclassified Microbacterium]|uniref:AAA family ATPase n=1 Tax=unclassified Microbacterium TaxID=2609290 RepID=UPI0028833529|nr:MULTISPECIES: AAA family ATPase [unclassified Microbacterium]
MKFSDTLTEIVSLDLKVGAVPALMGEPGIGKSSFVESLAKAMDTRAFTLPCNQLADKADLTGARLVPYEHNGEQKWKQVFYPHQVIQDAIDYANDNPREWPILFLDEINRSTSDVTSAALSLPTQRSIGSQALPSNLRLMIAGNTKGNVTTLDQASLSRFSIYNVEPDAQTLISVLPNLNAYVAAVLAKHPHLIFATSTPMVAAMVDSGPNDDDDDDAQTTMLMTDIMDAGDEMLQLTTPRTIDAVSRWLNEIDPSKLAEWIQQTTVAADGSEVTVLAEAVEAHIGRTEFAKHLVAEIAVALNSGAAAQLQQLTAPKPNCFTDLKGAPTVDHLEAIINGLTDHEKSGSLLYALFERVDNKVIVQQLAQQTTELEQAHARRLMELAMANQLEEDNVTALFNTSTPVGETAKAMLSAFM